MTYKYLNTTYKIEVIKSEKEALEIDGKNQISNKIELTNDKKFTKLNYLSKNKRSNITDIVFFLQPQ